MSRAGRTGEGNTFLQQMSAFSSFLFFQLGDVKNPDARESHQDFCKHNRWTVLNLFYGDGLHVILGIQTFFSVEMQHYRAF